MKLRSIPKLISYVFNSKKVWNKPKRAEVLIYDRCGSEYLLKYIDPSSVEILDKRGESVNMYVLVKVIFAGKWNRIKYEYEYVKNVSPSTIITFIDNNVSFYRLKKIFPELKTAFVQNGTRGELGDVFGALKQSAEFNVDYMLVHGTFIGQKYQQCINGNFVPIGSIKNNFFPVEKYVQKEKAILFVSQYGKPERGVNGPAWTEPDGTVFYWDQFYAAEEKVLCFLKHYCSKKDILLKISGRSEDVAGAEYYYFAKILSEAKWEFCPRSDLFGSYDLLNKNRRVVFIDSTLGYEALARGNKTACFSIRDFTLHNKATKFGWPADLPDSGPFWTNHADEREFERVMDYVTTVSDDEWEQTRQKYVPELMEFDPGNTRFLKVMRDLKVPLKAEDQANV